jgi:hypothetical protein
VINRKCLFILALPTRLLGAARLAPTGLPCGRSPPLRVVVELAAYRCAAAKMALPMGLLGLRPRPYGAALRAFKSPGRSICRTLSLPAARISELLQVHEVDPLTVAAQTGTSLVMIEKAYLKFIPSAMEEKLANLKEKAEVR